MFKNNCTCISKTNYLLLFLHLKLYCFFFLGCLNRICFASKDFNFFLFKWSINHIAAQNFLPSDPSFNLDCSRLIICQNMYIHVIIDLYLHCKNIIAIEKNRANKTQKTLVVFFFSWSRKLSGHFWDRIYNFRYLYNLPLGQMC